MHKFFLLFSFFLCTSLYALDVLPSFGKDELKINEKFSIYSRIGYPWPCEDDFQWKDEDRWQLSFYPMDAIELISTSSMAPDAFGGDLFQTWKFVAREQGAFELIFQRHDEYVHIPIKSGSV